MSRPFPYTYISCPCVDAPVPDPARKRRSKDSSQKSSPEQPPRTDDEEEEKTFDPRAPRSNFSLYPPEQLLYCEDCHEIKCPRCITEEIVCWFCPNCLFETPSSSVRSEGNRCARNCFNCPICVAPLAVTQLEAGSQQGPLVLTCGYCMWSTLDIGITFDKPTNIRAQLSKIVDSSSRKRQVSRSLEDTKSSLSMYSSVDEHAASTEEKGDAAPGEESAALDPSARFDALKSFYRNQISETSSSSTDPLGTDFGAGYSSPGALSRIMSIYTTTSRLGGLYGGNKKPKSKPPVMREALVASEGLKIPPHDAEEKTIQRMASDECGWDGHASIEQRASQSPDARFVQDLLPLPVLLRTKRSKRCKTCKHILVKPEFKPQSTRFRIRLIALSYIPLTTLRPLLPTTLPPTATPAPNLDALSPLKPIQFLLTLKNHMFDPVRITLATPSVTPGRVATKVTILCPQFDIGANSDVWDEALQSASAPTDTRARSGTVGGEKVAEAGKVWDKGRNWTTVVLELAPGTLPEGGGPPQADEDVLEIPVFVHMDWDSENQMETPVGKGQGDLVKRELAYWMVLGVGRIAPELKI